MTDLTDAPALLGGQVKTFHPEIYAGILARRNEPDDLASLAEHGIGLIDLVVVNVKPFAGQVGTGIVPIDEAVAMIDVGGIALLRAAARNYAGVTVVAHPAHYPQVIDELRRLGGVAPETRQRLAAEAFAIVAAYDAEVAAYLNHISGVRFPEQLTVVLQKQRDLPYGENPHQRAAFYRETTHRTRSLADAVQIQGADPTFNDLLDLDAAYRIASDFTGSHLLHRQAGQPGRPGLQQFGRRGVPPRARRATRSSAYGAVLAFNRDRGRGGRRGARPGRLRGGRRARLRGGGAAHPGRHARRCRCWRSPARRPAACPTTASRTSTSIASRAGCWWRRSTGWRSTTPS